MDNGVVPKERDLVLETSGICLDHDKRLFAAKQERILIDHGLNDIFEVGTQLFEMAHVRELNRDQRGPPANGEILAVHTVQLGVLGNAVQLIS